MSDQRSGMSSSLGVEISKEHFSRIQTLVQLGSWKIDLKTGFVDATKEARRIYGVGDRPLSLELIQSIPLPEFRNALDTELTNLISGKSSYNIEFYIRRADDGKLRFIHSMAEYDPLERIVTGTFQDITDRKEIELALSDSEQRYRSLFDNSVSGILYLDTEGRILEINRTMLTLLGSPSQEETKMINVLTFQPLVNSGFSAHLEKVIESGKPASSSAEYKSKWGITRYLEYYLTPIKSCNALIGIMAKIEDITSQKAATEQVDSLLKEKDLILREVHHRIKNNMSSIESLLRLQAEQSERAEVQSAIREAVSRLGSMRVLYEKLYQSEYFLETSSEAYLSKLIENIAEIFPESEHIKIEKELEDFMIPSEITFSLGIIINELLTNTLKYAFTEGRTDKLIRISSRRDHGKVEITVRDNGNGFDEAESESSGGFGLKLIKMLSDQIGGAVRFYNDSGAVFTINFSV